MYESSPLSVGIVGKSPLSGFKKLSHSLLFYVSIAAAIRGAASSQTVLLPARDECQSIDRSNGHAKQYPDIVTGNLNGTTLIVPISLETARELIPDEYEIAEKAYRELLPSFPDGMYPMMAQIVHDHDIQVSSLNSSMADFSRASLEFPFVDIFGDGHSSFRWAGTFLITASNQLAIDGSESYGIAVHPATFDPLCDAYASSPDGATYAKSASTDNTTRRFFSLEAVPSLDNIPYPLDFIKNITNQPVFANPDKCDDYLRLYNTTLSKGDTAPIPVVGKVSTNLEPFVAPQTWDGVYGWRLATPFLEPLEPSVCQSGQ